MPSHIASRCAGSATSYSAALGTAHVRCMRQACEKVSCKHLSVLSNPNHHCSGARPVISFATRISRLSPACWWPTPHLWTGEGGWRQGPRSACELGLSFEETAANICECKQKSIKNTCNCKVVKSHKKSKRTGCAQDCHSFQAVLRSIARMLLDQSWKIQPSWARHSWCFEARTASGWACCARSDFSSNFAFATVALPGNTEVFNTAKRLTIKGPWLPVAYPNWKESIQSMYILLVFNVSRWINTDFSPFMQEAFVEQWNDDNDDPFKPQQALWCGLATNSRLWARCRELDYLRKGWMMVNVRFACSLTNDFCKPATTFSPTAYWGLLRTLL